MSHDDPEFKGRIGCCLHNNSAVCFRFKDGEQKLVEGVEEKWDDAKDSMHHFGESTDRCKPLLWGLDPHDRLQTA